MAMKERNTGRDGLRSGFRYVGLGVELVIPLLLGLWGGYKLDEWLETEPWLMIAGVVIGMVAGFLNFFRAVLPRKGGNAGAGDDR